MTDEAWWWLPPKEGEHVRNPSCVEQWPECGSSEYDPQCCRFPKSCSCYIKATDLPAPAAGEPTGGTQ